MRFILDSVSIHPNVPIADIDAMIKYSQTTAMISDSMEMGIDVQIILLGDINVDARLNLHAPSFMKLHFNLDHVI